MIKLSQGYSNEAQGPILQACSLSSSPRPPSPVSARCPPSTVSTVAWTMAAPTSKDAHRSRGVALCLVSALGFGCMAIFAKDAYRQDVGINALLALRFAFAATLFWTIARVRGPLRLPDRRLLPTALGLGAIGYAAQSGLFF